jgi:hypothetical protein
MDKGNRVIEQSRPSIAIQGGQFGVRSAFIGSIVFALVDLIGIYINTYIIQHINASLNIAFYAGWLVFIVVLGSAFAYFPALLLGRFLANWLDKDASQQRLSKRIAVAKGALLGVIAGVAICTPILGLEYAFIQQSGHGDFFVFVARAIEAVIIALLAGGWTGLKLEHRISR